MDDGAGRAPSPPKPARAVEFVSRLWTLIGERKVVQWTLAYIAIAFSTLHAVELASHAMEWGESVSRVAFLLLLVGLPVFVTLAWYHGDLGNRHIDRTELSIIVMLLALGAGLFVTLVGSGHSGKVTADAREDPPPDVPGTEVSLAVLPFVGDNAKSQDFADGWSDELITTLGGISAFHVPGRFSSFRFKGKNGNDAEVAAELRVNHLLEGSVRLTEARVRVRVQLVDPKKDRVLWSQSYDRALDRNTDNISDVESDIARQVASQLQVQLVGPDEAMLNRHGTQDSEAHRLYLIGTKALRTRTLDNLSFARTEFEEAIKRDRNYADPYAGLAQVHALLMGNFQQELQDGARLGSEAAERAAALDPRSGAALVSRAALKELQYVTADDVQARQAALQNIATAVNLLPPNVADAKFWYGFVLMYDEPNFDQAQHWLEAALTSDSEYRMARLNATTLRWWAGDDEPARKGFQELMHLAPDYSFAYLFLSWLELSQGHSGKALGIVRDAETKAKDPILAYRHWQLAMNLGDTPEAAKALEVLGGDPFHDMLRDALRFAAAGRYADELALMEKAQADGSDGGRFGYAIASLAHALGSPKDAAAFAAKRFPGLVANEAVNFFNTDAALELGAAWTATHETAKAQGLMRRIDTYLNGATIPRLSSVDYWRAIFHAIQGENDQAIADLNRAYDRGFRMIWFDREVRSWHLQFVPLPIDRDPRFGTLAQDVRFKAWVGRIRADNAHQLRALNNAAAVVTGEGHH